jgi:hypothetical protein
MGWFIYRAVNHVDKEIDEYFNIVINTSFYDAQFNCFKSFRVAKPTDYRGSFAFHHHIRRNVGCRYASHS